MIVVYFCSWFVNWLHRTRQKEILFLTLSASMYPCFRSLAGWEMPMLHLCCPYLPLFNVCVVKGLNTIRWLDELDFNPVVKSVIRKFFILFVFNAAIFWWRTSTSIVKSCISSLFSSFLFNCAIGSSNFLGVGFWTVDLWCLKRPLYQLSRNHCLLSVESYSIVVCTLCCAPTDFFARFLNSALMRRWRG